MVFLLVIFLVNLSSMAAGLGFMYKKYGLQYTNPVIIVVILGVLHTLIMYGIGSASIVLENTVHKELHIHSKSNEMYLPKTFIVLCAMLIMVWLMNAIVLTELPLFHVEGFLYTSQVPLVMSIANVLGGIVGGMLFFLWLIFNFDMTIL